MGFTTRSSHSCLISAGDRVASSSNGDWRNSEILETQPQGALFRGISEGKPMSQACARISQNEVQSLSIGPVRLAFSYPFPKTFHHNLLKLKRAPKRPHGNCYAAASRSFRNPKKTGKRGRSWLPMP